MVATTHRETGRPPLEPRAVDARVQRATARPGGRRHHPAPRAGEDVPVRLVEPGRVLHGARGRADRAGGRRRRRPLERRAGAAGGTRSDPRARARADRAPGEALEEGALPRPRRRGDPDRHGRRARRGRAARTRRRLPARDLPRADAARRQPRTAVSVHLRPHAQPGCPRARSGDRRGAVRPRQGAGGPPALRLRRRRQAADARERDRALPRSPLPGDGDRRALGLPRHARRRLRGLRRRGRPARGRRAGAAAPPLRRRGATGDLELDLTRDAGAAAARARRRGRPGLRDPRAARPRRPRPAARPRPAGARVPGLTRCDAGTAGPRERAPRPVRRDPSRRLPRPPALRVVRGQLRGLRPRRVARPGRDRDEDGGVPDERRQPARAGADRARRGRQAERLPRRAEGALRRAPQHRVVARARAGGRPRRLRLRRPESAREDDARRAARGRCAASLRPRRHRELSRRDCTLLRGPEPLHGRSGDRGGRRRALQLPDRVRPPGALPEDPRRAVQPPRPPDRPDPRRRGGSCGGDERAGSGSS